MEIFVVDLCFFVPKFLVKFSRSHGDHRNSELPVQLIQIPWEVFMDTTLILIVPTPSLFILWLFFSVHRKKYISCAGKMEDS
jgi:hypothetical protein